MAESQSLESFDLLDDSMSFEYFGRIGLLIERALVSKNSGVDTSWCWVVQPGTDSPGSFRWLFAGRTAGGSVVDLSVEDLRLPLEYCASWQRYCVVSGLPMWCTLVMLSAEFRDGECLLNRGGFPVVGVDSARDVLAAAWALPGPRVSRLDVGSSLVDSDFMSSEWNLQPRPLLPIQGADGRPDLPQAALAELDALMRQRIVAAVADAGDVDRFGVFFSCLPREVTVALERVTHGGEEQHNWPGSGIEDAVAALSEWWNRYYELGYRIFSVMFAGGQESTGQWGTFVAYPGGDAEEWDLLGGLERGVMDKAYARIGLRV